MGNTIGSQRVEDLRSYLIESPDVVVHSLLASYKLFKVFHCAHESFKHGGVVVKLFIPNENEEDDHTDLQIDSVLKPYRDATFLIQCRFSSPIHPNVVPYEAAEILNRSAILLRQYFGRNLHDRIYSQPHLTKAHKIWISIQILLSLAQMHSVGVIHGDIKNENLFVIGSFHAILTDFSTFIKPVYLPLNDPVAATSLFFESGIKRRRCFIAPERFTEKVSGRVLDEHGRRMTFFDKEFTRDFIRMDIFSAGLAIAELFLDGQHVIDLPELLAYRNGSFDLYSQVISKIPDVFIRDMVTKMIQADPAKRYPSGISCLEEIFRSISSGFKDVLIPLLLLSTHPVYANADMRMILIRYNWSYMIGGGPSRCCSNITDYDHFTELEIFNQCIQSSSLLGRGVMPSIEPIINWSHSGGSFPHPNLAAGPLVVEKLIALYGEGMQIHLNNQKSEEWRDKILPSKINLLFNEWWTVMAAAADDVSTNRSLSFDPEISPILFSLLGSTVCACNFSKSKHVYLDLVENLLQNIFNHEKHEHEPEADADFGVLLSDYVIPYIYELISTESTRIRAIECMSVILEKLTVVETGLFSEYLFPLCIQLDSEIAIPFASVLIRQATRLSQPDAKRLQAIALFADRMITRASERNWTNQLITHMDDLYSLVGTINGIQNKFLPALTQWGTGKTTRKIFCQCIHKVTKLIKDAKIYDPFISNLLVDCLKDPELMIEAIDGVGRLAGCENFPIPAIKPFIVTCCKALIPLMSHPWFEVRNRTETVLVDVFGSVMNPVDQFVFLRHLLPEGCRTLFDLSRAVRNVPSIVPPISVVVPSQPPAAVSSQEVKSSVPPISVAANHTMSLQLVNPFFRAPQTTMANCHGPSDPAELGFRSYSDWRWEVSGYPKPLSTDLGCLSNADGSLMSLYTGTIPQGLTDLHRRKIANSPCIPSSFAASTVPTVWKPENLLLATLHDYSFGGVAVPVVSGDTTDDGRLIVAGGADCVVRMWRTSALETDAVMQSSRTWKVENSSRLYKIKTLRNTKSVAIGTDDSIAVFGLLDIGNASANQPIMISPSHKFGHVVAMDCFDTDFSSCLVSACERGGVVCWDIRTNKISWSVPIDPLQYLSPSGLVLSKDARSFVVSGLAGNMTVFDNRFLKPVWHYSIGGNGGITNMCASSEPRSVWVSTGPETCLYDIESGGEPKFVAATVSSPGQPPVPRPSLVRKDQHSHAPSDFSISRVLKSEANARCILECAGNPWTLISGHNDGVARYWSRNMSGVVCPLQLDPTPAISSQNMVIQQPVRDSDIVREETQAYAGRPCTVTEGHRDVISDICIASLQYDIIVTAGRDGLIKLWK